MAKHFPLIFILLLLFGCPVAAQTGETPVEVLLFEGGEGLDFYRDVAREYQETSGRPVILQGDPAMADRMRMRVLEGNFPEVTNADVDVWTLVKYEHMLSFDNWLDQLKPTGGTWRESFLPGTLKAYQKDGKTYGIPLVYVVWSVYYNKRLFREHDLSVPRTQSEFLHVCERLKKSGINPIAFQGRYSFYARPLVEHTYFHNAGRAAYEALQSAEPGSFDTPAMRESLGFLNTLARNYFSPGFSGMSHTEAQLEFFDDRAAMIFCGSWLYSEMQDNIPDGFELGAFPLPLPDSPNAQPGVEYASNGYFFAFANSMRPEAAAGFLQALTSRENATRFARERGIPVAVLGANTELHPKMADVAAQLESIKDTFGPKAGPTLSGLGQVWTDQLNRILEGTATVEEVTRSMEAQAGKARLAESAPDSVEVRHPRKTQVFLIVLALGFLTALTGARRQSPHREVKVGLADAAKFLLPSLFVFAFFFALPSFAALGAAMLRWDGIGPAEWVGLLHLKKLLLESDVFWLALLHNLILMIIPALFIIPLALLLAVLLQSGVVGARVFRIAFFFPNLIGVAGILLWQQLYNPQIGPINRLLTGLANQFENFAWLSNANLYYALIPMAVWSATGFNMVLFLAAMQSIPQHLYEAAEVNGAGAAQKFWYITLPMIRETLVVAVVLLVIGGMKAFEAIWLLTNQAPTSETHVVGTLMIRSLFVEQRVGQAAALALLLFLIVLVGSLFANRVGEGKNA